MSPRKQITFRMHMVSTNSSPAAAWRAVLGESWRCQLANDFDQMKVETYEGDRGTEKSGTRTLQVSRYRTCLHGWSICMGVVSMPRPFARRKLTYRKLMRSLTKDGRAPRAIVLENVYGCLTSSEGFDLARGKGLRIHCFGASRFGLQVRAAVVNTVCISCPQSRPRVVLSLSAGTNRF
jgi:DNA (cytosine-5)-methyltransferase 1